MKGTGRRIAAACAAIALVAGLLPAQALAAAQDMAAGSAEMQAQAQDGFVADRVYAIIGDDYAMMLSETANDRTIDIIDRDYNTTLEFTEAFVYDLNGRFSFINKTGVLGYQGLCPAGVMVEDTSTGLGGIRGFDGKTSVVDCKYTALYWSDGGYIEGVLVGSDGTVTLDILDGDASLVASGPVGKNSDYWRGSYGNYYVYQSGAASFTMGATGKTYAIEGSALVEQDLGEQGFRETQIDDNLVERYDRSTYETAYYAKDGTRISALDGWGYRGSAEQGKHLFANKGDGTQAKLVDGSGATIATFAATSALNGTPSWYDWSTAVPMPKIYCGNSGLGACQFYNLTGQPSAAVPLSDSEMLDFSPSGEYVYKSESTSAGYRPYAYYDSELNVFSARPALGSLLGSMADGTPLYASGVDAQGVMSSFSAGEPNVLRSDGSEVSIGGYQLSMPVRTGTLDEHATPAPDAPLVSMSAAKVKNRDAYTAKSASGKYGLVASSGEAVVPFEHDDIFIGAAGTSLSQGTTAMVKDSSGTWRFVDVNAAVSIDDPAIGPTADDPVKDGPAMWMRFAGENAYGTMTMIVNAGWLRGSDAVVVATFDGYWDALTASGLAGFLGCPVLMTDTNSLSPATRSEIERLGAKTAFVAGGTAAVSAGVEAELSAMGLSVVRAAGDNAAGTARDAYEKAKAYGEWGKTAIVATADGYWDALAMSPYSYYAHAPIFLAQEPAGSAMRLDADTLAAIRAGGFDTVLVAGGEAAVSPDVVGQLSGLAVERLAGDTAVETSRAIAAYCAANGMSKAKVAVATTDGYWDALTGAALCGKTRTPMVLASPGNAAAAADGFVSSEASTIAVGYIFGGDAAVAPASEIALREATK